jgi:prevent-host-death family protein
MITAGIKELKNQLSRYIGYVKRGDEVLITERGRVIARVVKEDSPQAALRQALRPLVLSGLIAVPLEEIDREHLDPLTLPGEPLSEAIIEDRR